MSILCHRCIENANTTVMSCLLRRHCLVVHGSALQQLPNKCFGASVCTLFTLRILTWTEKKACEDTLYTYSEIGVHGHPRAAALKRFLERLFIISPSPRSSCNLKQKGGKVKITIPTCLCQSLNKSTENQFSYSTTYKYWHNQVPNDSRNENIATCYAESCVIKSKETIFEMCCMQKNKNCSL